MFRRAAWIGLVVLSACGSEHPAAKEPDSPLAESPPATPAPTAIPETDNPPVAKPPEIDPAKTSQPTVQVTIPLDSRTAVEATTPPPPISGGTLLVTRDARFAVAADPDRDRISIVDLVYEPTPVVTIALEPGDEPGRLVEDNAGLVHVALRRGAAVVSIDPASAAIIARRPVCASPRGIAYKSASDSLVIACANGELNNLAAVTYGEASVRARVPVDARDVVLAGERMFVSRFKSAELLALASDGAVTATNVPGNLRDTFPEHTGAQIVDELAPDFAFRTVQAGDGRMFMVHQGARTGEVDLEVKPDTTSSVGAVATIPSSPYGGGGPPGTLPTCDGVVQSELTVFTADGVPQATARLPGLLPVDAALSSNGVEVAVVFAGSIAADAPARSVQRLPSSGAAGAAGAAEPVPVLPGRIAFSVAVFDTRGLASASANPAKQCLTSMQTLTSDIVTEPIAVAYADGQWIIQNREPAQLIRFRSGTVAPAISLGGDSVADTGHNLFHHDAGGGIACASCHAGGGEDGHVWHFSGFGPRRTQALHVGLEGTAPFHWAGDMAGMPELMEEVLVSRMGGVHESGERAAALQHWLFSLRPPAPLRAADDPAVARGRALFEGSAECASCHLGDKLTSNHNEDVGTGEVLQVPSLVGIGYRGPWMHSGCANSLRERFDAACGGSKHGNTGDLDAAQIDDLVAYLESL